jgi:hypothetical protein
MIKLTVIAEDAQDLRNFLGASVLSGVENGIVFGYWSDKTQWRTQEITEDEI